MDGHRQAVRLPTGLAKKCNAGFWVFLGKTFGKVPAGFWLLSLKATKQLTVK
jgi:hypothetical protein